MALTIREMLAGAIPLSTAEGSQGMHAAAAGLRAHRAQQDQRDQYARSQDLLEQQHSDTQENRMFEREQSMNEKRRAAAVDAIKLMQSGDPAGRAQAEAILQGLGVIEGGQGAMPRPGLPEEMPPEPPPPTAMEAVDEAMADFDEATGPKPALRVRDMLQQAPMAASPAPEPAPTAQETAPPLATRSSDMVPGRGSVSVNIGGKPIQLDLSAVDANAQSIGEGFMGTLNESGVPTTANLPPEIVAQARRIAGNDPVLVRKILLDEAERRAKAKSEQLNRQSMEARARSMSQRAEASGDAGLRLKLWQAGERVVNNSARYAKMPVLREQMENANTLEGLLMSDDPLADKAAFTTILQSMFKGATSDRELRFLQSAGGIENIVESEWNNWVEEGRIPDDIKQSMLALSRQAKGRIQGRLSKDAEAAASTAVDAIASIHPSISDDELVTYRERFKNYYLGGGGSREPVGRSFSDRAEEPEPEDETVSEPSNGPMTEEGRKILEALGIDIDGE